jgi:hypothetical protein
MSADWNRFMWSLFTACALAAAAMVAVHDAYAAPATVAATYTATTENMSPAGTNLRVQIFQWQDAAARAEAVAAMAAGADAPTPLAKLPTVGYLWVEGSPVGYSLKYAHTTPLPEGGERVTLVTDRRLGSYDFKGWSVPSPAAQADVPYSVVELYMSENGSGTGNLSLAAAVELDEQAGEVSLAETEAATRLLANVRRGVLKP